MTAHTTHIGDASVLVVAKRVTDAERKRARATIAALEDDTGPAPNRDELASAVRTVCAMLAQNNPGGSVELRVPPFAAVQLGIGERGRHTRGTPPNVVQTDAITLLRLAGGSLHWVDARAEHVVQASGIHADLGSVLPLPEFR
ncbi:hypothetical protein SDC9_199680 [bioreactor metagenome]|uniref:Bacterial SCP orthologue domain-containing protein n=1 Tax=bioreactor metagenome TaxID=1076179 RepID=A0A645IL51_9ZZZZ